MCVNLIFAKSLAPAGLIIDQFFRESVVGSTNFYISFFLLCMYLLSANIMLINLLIAIFSNTYVEVEAKSGEL